MAGCKFPGKSSAAAQKRSGGELAGALCLLIPTAGLSSLAIACDLSRVEPWKGQSFSQELAAAARSASGATQARAVGPGIMSSADRIPGRLNIEVDQTGVVTGFWCE